jgi:transmembrane sensor
MNNQHIEELLPSWFDGTINAEGKEKVEQWKEASEENRQIYAGFLRAWEGIEQLKRMKNYDAEKALIQVNSKLTAQKKYRFTDIFQKVAAVLFLPLIITTILFSIDKSQKEKDSFVAWNTIEIPAGMRSEFWLPDSTKVYLSSKTTLSYPMEFSNSIREIKLSGEAYFEVAEDREMPFIVNTGRINIEVTGTEFIATNYDHEGLTEIALLNGSINLFQGDYFTTKKDITQLKPGEKAIYKENTTNLIVEQINAEKYTAWKAGILMFREDPLPEVVRRLNRWYNVDIQLEGPELKDWTYTATFEDESLIQVLELLKISAPVDYTIKQREIKTDKTFSKMEIIIKQKKR